MGKTWSLFKNRRFYFIFKSTISFLLIFLLINIVDWGRAYIIIKASNKYFFIFAPVLWLMGLLFAALRWRLILFDAEVKFSFFQAYRTYLRGLFYNIFLPGVIGGDAVRIGICYNQSKCKISTATYSVILERVLGVISLFFFILLAFCFFSQNLFSALAFRMVISILIISIIVIISFFVFFAARKIWGKCFSKEDTSKVRKFFFDGFQSLKLLKGKSLVLVLILSSLFQLMDIFVSYILSRALGINLGFSVFFTIIPLVYLVTILPISLGGLGVREGAFAFLLAKFGVSASVAITLSFLIYFNRVLLAGIGGCVQLAEPFFIIKECN